jgi:glycosyltransferase involved in cell wall biosynthesis
VSVIIPVYNAEKYLEDSLYSLLQQTYTNFEVIAINDGSNDRSLEILNFFSSHDGRLKVYSNEYNRGIVYTLNRGLNLSRGDLIARMDADDIAFSNRLEIQVVFLLQNSKVGVLGANFQHFGHENTTSILSEYHDQIELDLYFFNPMCHPVIMFRKSILEMNDIRYRDMFSHMEDWDLWFQLIRCTKFHNLNKVLLKYRIEGQNISVINRESKNERFNSFFQFHLRIILGHISEQNVRMHLLLSNYNYNYEKLADIKSYKTLLSKSMVKYGFDKQKVIETIDRQLSQLFYRITDKSVLKGLLFMFYFRKFNFQMFKYLLSALKRQ